MVNAFVALVIVFICIIVIISGCSIFRIKQGHKDGVCCLWVALILVPIFCSLLIAPGFKNTRQNRIRDRNRQSPEFSVDNVVIGNIDATAGNTLSPTFTFTLHAKNRHESGGICYTAAEARLSFYHNADSGTLAFATMTAAPVNLPPGNDDPIGIPFSAGSTNVTLTDKEARVLIENKQNLDRFNASLTVIALVKNDISDARSRWLEIKCGSMSLVPNFTQVFTCRLSGL